jgi:hypothetical protein
VAAGGAFTVPPCLGERAQAVVDPATPLTPPKLTDDQIANLAAGLGAEESA